MRLSEEASVLARALEVVRLEHCVDLGVVGIYRVVLECRDEGVEVHCRLALLDGMSFRCGCNCCSYESLRDRKWRGGLLVATAAGGEAKCRDGSEE